MSIEVSKNNLNDILKQFKDIKDYKINYLSFLKSRIIVEFENELNKKFILEFDNVICFKNIGLSFNQLSKFTIECGGSQSIALARRFNNYKIENYFQLYVWDKEDNIMPKLDILSERVIIS